jgi:hypothetical protein
MKKYIVVFLMAVMVTTATPAIAVQPVELNAEAKAALIKELTLKLNELIISLNALLAGQDARIKSEVSSSRVNAEIYYTKNPTKGYVGACTDIKNRINESLTSTKATGILKTLDMSCFDTKDNYALSIKTSKEYACADSTGFWGTTTQAVTGTACK